MDKLVRVLIWALWLGLLVVSGFMMYGFFVM
jgi:hypothetical protein